MIHSLYLLRLLKYFHSWLLICCSIFQAILIMRGLNLWWKFMANASNPVNSRKSKWGQFTMWLKVWTIYLNCQTYRTWPMYCIRREYEIYTISFDCSIYICWRLNQSCEEQPISSPIVPTPKAQLVQNRNITDPMASEPGVIKKLDEVKL